ncbi:BTB/POZ and MATH domain-containing protein 1 [Brachypodium distachyon]|uniref:BTB/POZ and MATH domain-containing protein 1 n=1 Tax=Brachypodium distachyon TaxID=15368 RepID=UPI0001C70768|nr:BTB/POZ and MATH domain-containing protein 1 [Brachypodium distachyon]|eukprot:XP_014757793.1 BTB/POZ and MATH domain-containing protein 1 [Brachypodium distachyon]
MTITSGFHLLRIDGHSQTKNIPPGQKLSSQGFAIGGHSWRLDYYPTGLATAPNPGSAVSVYLQLMTHNVKKLLQARYSFSILDQSGATAYELPASTGTFAGVPLIITQPPPRQRQQTCRG